MRDVALRGDAGEVTGEASVLDVGAERDEAVAPRRRDGALAHEALGDHASPPSARLRAPSTAAAQSSSRKSSPDEDLVADAPHRALDDPAAPVAEEHLARRLAQIARLGHEVGRGVAPRAGEGELRLRVDVGEARERADAAEGDRARDVRDVALAAHRFGGEVAVQGPHRLAVDAEIAAAQPGRGRGSED